MKSRRLAAWGALGLLLASLGGPAPSTAALQNPNLLAPNVPRRGWAHILTVTPKWIVLQNVADGRQYPVPISKIELFLIRWPTTANRIALNSLVEVNGLEEGSNGIQTPHVDIYQGAAANLVTPMYLTAGMGQITPNLGLQTNLQFNMFQPLQGVGISPLMANPTPWVHAVGPIANIAPLQLGIGNNNVATIIPSPGMTVTTITVGTPALLRRGDLAYFLADAATPNGLVLGQLIVEKKEPMP